jgi:hypothetical protein
MQVEPTLNQMCDYIDLNKPKDREFEIRQYKEGKLLVFIHSSNYNVFHLPFSSMKNAAEFLFNYYFAINNK